MKWKTNGQKLRCRKDRDEINETRRLVNKACFEQRKTEENRKKEDLHRAMILQAAIKAGIYRGQIPIGPTLRSSDTPKKIRLEQKKRSFFKQMSRTAKSDKAFKKENREWNEDKQSFGALLNPV